MGNKCSRSHVHDVPIPLLGRIEELWKKSGGRFFPKKFSPFLELSVRFSMWRQQQREEVNSWKQFSMATRVVNTPSVM